MRLILILILTLMEITYLIFLLHCDIHMKLSFTETDKCLVEDESFKSFVDLYASNKTLFFEDYAEVRKGRVYLLCACADSDV